MPWYFYLFEFVSGLFLANGVPYFVQGISGHRFPAPFGYPPGVGESSPLSNTLWGFANLTSDLFFSGSSRLKVPQLDGSSWLWAYCLRRSGFPLISAGCVRGTPGNSLEGGAASIRSALHEGVLD
jgi:hypothetical protein